jgi:hypothetical protein
MVDVSLGFYILRHVSNETTNKYWIICYECIRKFYSKNEIIIIDDNSNYNYITPKQLTNTSIIRSEYHKRGELLPYIYYLKDPRFDRAVFVHDSVFFNKYIDFGETNLPLLSFHKNVESREGELKLINVLANSHQLLDTYNKDSWNGCFGVMCVIDSKFLIRINSEYNLINLIDNVTCRKERMYLERIMGLIFMCENKKDNRPYCSVLGNISRYFKGKYNWGYTFDNYIQDELSGNLEDVYIIKIFTGR